MAAVDDQTIFRSSRKKHLFLLLAMVVVALMGFHEGKAFPPMYVIGGIGGLTSLVFAWEVIARRSVLKLDRDGFEVRNTLETKRFSWNQADEFEAAVYGVYFRVEGTTEKLVPNVFEAPVEEVQAALNSYRMKFGGARSPTPKS